MDLIVAKIGSDVSPGLGFIPTLELEVWNGPDTTVTPFYFSVAQKTHEEALAVAEQEAMNIIKSRYPDGTKYRIDKEPNRSEL